MPPKEENYCNLLEIDGMPENQRESYGPQKPKSTNPRGNHRNEPPTTATSQQRPTCPAPAITSAEGTEQESPARKCQDSPTQAQSPFRDAALGRGRKSDP